MCFHRTLWNCLFPIGIFCQEYCFCHIEILYCCKRTVHWKKIVVTFDLSVSDIALLEVILGQPDISLPFWWVIESTKCSLVCNGASIICDSCCLSRLCVVTRQVRKLVLYSLLGWETSQFPEGNHTIHWSYEITLTAAASGQSEYLQPPWLAMETSLDFVNKKLVLWLHLSSWISRAAGMNMLCIRISFQIQVCFTECYFNM